MTPTGMLTRKGRRQFYIFSSGVFWGLGGVFCIGKRRARNAYHLCLTNAIIRLSRIDLPSGHAVRAFPGTAGVLFDRVRLSAPAG